jgi:hypothetical protein
MGEVTPDDATRCLEIDMLVAGGRDSPLAEFRELARRAGGDVPDHGVRLRRRQRRQPDLRPRPPPAGSAGGGARSAHKSSLFGMSMEVSPIAVLERRLITEHAT